MLTPHAESARGSKGPDRVELKRYLQIVGRRWKIVVLVALATIGFTVYFVSGQSPSYESTGTYVVRPRNVEPDQAVEATAALSRGAEINSTFARIARSDIVKTRAKDVLRASGTPTSGLSVRSQVLPGTNILEIGATGDDPDVVAAYAAAVGEQTSAYLDDTGEVYLLQQLDAPDVPDEATASNDVLTLIVGAVFGLGAGAAIAFAAEYLGEPSESSAMAIWDETTWAYTEDYFRHRLRQEMSRCNIPTDMRARPEPKRRRNIAYGAFTVGLLTIHTGDESSNGSDPGPTPEDLREAAHALQPHLRVQDIFAYIGDDTFGIIFPDLPVEPAREVLTDWTDFIDGAGTSRGDVKPVRVSVRVCECDGKGFLGDAETVRIANAV